MTEKYKEAFRKSIDECFDCILTDRESMMLLDILVRTVEHGIMNGWDDVDYLRNIRSNTRMYLTDYCNGVFNDYEVEYITTYMVDTWSFLDS